MQTLFASKLYKASKRKDKIQAALLATGNLSLVQQLADSLDEEYKTASNLGVDEPTEETSEPTIDDFKVDEDIDPEKDLMTVDDAKGVSKAKTPRHHSSAGSMNSAPSPSFEDSEPIDELSSNAPESSDNEPKPAEETEASTKIVSSESISLTVIRDSLNSREDTHGVLRVAEKDDEIWIYYKDEVNLNNVMTEVIEYMANAGYAYLEFNRLARSDNAIVFMIVNATSAEPKEDK